jgi:osmotically-inducible protein OsmY
VSDLSVPPSDTSLHRAIARALAEDPIVKADEISVQVLDAGTVVLRGTVGSVVQHARAARATRAVPGVHRVDDQLRTRPLGIDGRANSDTEAAVLDELIADPALHADDISAKADDGAVTLAGFAATPAERDRARAIALEVPGVRRVDNDIAVWSGVSPAEVTARVTDALGTASGGLQVDVRGADVTLTGTVASQAEREAAVAAAADVPGVGDVHDGLRVER